ncbi:unnamed protein product [Toxocara canis]|uniref:Tau95 domain-containing protein n=1 Tax=Toxocara canis TaxID=6265 RepID=A0A183ULY8_TOXCA|nr:unnamed protein product [Toxocara canis]
MGAECCSMVNPSSREKDSQVSNGTQLIKDRQRRTAPERAAVSCWNWLWLVFSSMWRWLKGMSKNCGDSDATAQIRTLFEARPMWTKFAIKKCTGLTDYEFRLAVKKYAFYIIDGPWAHLWCRFGYEPRFYPDQDTACAVPVTKSSSSSSDDSGNDQTDFLYIRGQQTRFSKIWFSICDIKLPIADAILEHDENPLTRRARADDRYGWLPPGALDAVKQVIQEDICSVVQLAGVPDVVTKKDYRYSTQRKNCLLTHAREAFDGIVSKCEDDKGVASNISNEDEHKGAHEGAELKLSGLKEESQRKGDAECMKEENCMKDSAGCLEGYNETLINLDDDECAQTGVGSAVENEGIGELGVLTSNMYNINDFVAFVMNRYSAGVGWCGGEEGTEADFDKYDLNGSYAVSAWNGYAERAEFDERYVTSLNGWFLDGSPLSVNALGANTSLTMEENVNGSGKAVEAQNFDDETEKEFNEILSSMNKILNSDSNS